VPLAQNTAPSSDPTVLRPRLRAFLTETFGLAPAAVADGAPLFSSGALDSHCMIELLVFLEEATGHRPGWAEVSLENLDSVAKILAWAARRAAR
jgi:acyl carrier protein